MTKIHITRIQGVPGDRSCRDRNVEVEDVENPEKLKYHETVTEDNVRQRTNSQDECESNESDVGEGYK